MKKQAFILALADGYHGAMRYDIQDGYYCELDSDLTIVVHHNEHYGWKVTDPSSGLGWSIYANTRKEAIEAAKTRVKDYGKGQILALINRARMLIF